MLWFWIVAWTGFVEKLVLGDDFGVMAEIADLVVGIHASEVAETERKQILFTFSPELAAKLLAGTIIINLLKR